MTKINTQIFREYDIRGLAEEDLNPEVVRLIGKSFASYLNKEGLLDKGVVVGRDNRLTSEAYSEALIEALVKSGVKVFDVGLVVSPIYYYAAMKLGANGMMITASHNPKEYNGFKVNTVNGSVAGAELQKLLPLIEAEDFVMGEGEVEEVDILTDYYAMLKEKITLDRPLKVVIDCGNGTASLFAEQVLKSWGCEVVPLFCESDGNFPNHIADPVKLENATDMIAKVAETGADLGIGFDGDGDRLGVVDEKGHMIFGDMMMILFYREILKKNPGMTCLVEVKCSEALYEECDKLGGKPAFSKTGHSLIKARMKEEGSKFAGEMSGHMFFADEFFGFDDAFYAAGRLLRIVAAQDKPLSELFADVPKYVSTPEVRVETTDGDKFKIVEQVVADFKKDYEVEDIDGARIIFPSGGWGLVRSSNTQPVLVVRAEAKNEDDLAKIKKTLEEKLLTFDSIKNIDWSGKEG